MRTTEGYNLSKANLFEEWIFKNSKIPDYVSKGKEIPGSKHKGETRFKFWGGDHVAVTVWKHSAEKGGDNYTIDCAYSYDPDTKEVSFSYRYDEDDYDETEGKYKNFSGMLKITSQPEEHIINVDIYCLPENSEKKLIGSIQAFREMILPLLQ